MGLFNLKNNGNRNDIYFKNCLGLCQSGVSAQCICLKKLAATFTAAMKNATAHVGGQSTVSFSWFHIYSDKIGAELTLVFPQNSRKI
jgi:hypothetical protein